MKRDEFRLLHRLRVRWAEVDMQKIVFNAHYLMYFDTAVADYWRALGLPYEDSMRRLEGDLYVRKATIEFHSSARMDDRLDIALRCARVGNSSLSFRGGMFRGEDLLVTCDLVYVFADPQTQTSRPVPNTLRQALAGFEAGEPMLRVETGRWEALVADAATIRTQVLVTQQRPPAEREWNAEDAGAVHAVAYNRLGQPVGTGRLLPTQQRLAKVECIAVHQAVRGVGVGEQVLRALAGVAQQRGDAGLVLHSPRTAARFFARLGFRPEGEPFARADTPHIAMRSTLPLAN